ncbi:MAG TPA: PHP domain-containing protein, partial [Rhabdochlamydiaceae bacterium]
MILISPHSHPESSLTGSTLPAMIKRAVALGRTHFSYTDLGHLSSCLKAYGLAKKANLKFAAGIEFYFKDPKDSLISGTSADRCRYFNSTLFCRTQDAYQELCRTVSKTDMPKITVQDEVQSLWSWNELEHLAKFDTLLVVGGIHCLVGKTFLADGPELAEKVFLKCKQLFGDRLSVALICEPWDKKYAKVIEIQYQDGTKDSLLASDLISTNKARKMKACDLLDRSGHFEVESKTVGSTYFTVNKRIKDVKEHKGFLPLPVDATLEINRFLLEMGRKHSVPVLVSDYAFYAEKADHVVQTMVMGGSTKLKSDLHMKTEEEFRVYLQDKMGLSSTETSAIINSNDEWAKNFDNFELKYEWRFADSGGNDLQKCMDIIKSKGLMRWEDPKWTARLKEEILVIAKNKIKDLSPYFLPIHDVINFYEENGRLTGPGRGSSAGSLIAYLMGITKVNPFLYDLSFNRFYSTDRIEALKLADIDSDLESRDLLVGKDGKSGYLYERWGTKAAQISTRGKVRLKSSIKDVNRYFHGSVQKEIDQLCRKLPDAGQGITDDQFLFGFEDEDGNHIDGLFETSEALQKYAEERPSEWIVVKQALGITRSFSRHACSFVVADRPISDFVPTKDGNIIQYEATATEEAGLIKYDFLVINQLKDIRVCLDLINKKNGEKHKVGRFSHKGKETYIWDLPEDPDAFRSVWNGETESCFQINTVTMTPFVKEIMPQNMEDLSIILSLVRPGP